MRYILFAAALVVIAAITPGAMKLQSVPEGEATRNASEAPGYAMSATPSAKPTNVSAQSGRKVRIEADPTGHFRAEFKFNGRKIDAMIDTGATVVAINVSTARKIGIAVPAADFKYEVSTANGTARAAAATIDDVQIGRIRLDGVQAMVLEDKALKGVLVGMSVLKRLARYQVEGQVLLLEQ